MSAMRFAGDVVGQNTHLIASDEVGRLSGLLEERKYHHASTQTLAH